MLPIVSAAAFAAVLLAAPTALQSEGSAFAVAPRTAGTLASRGRSSGLRASLTPTTYYGANRGAPSVVSAARGGEAESAGDGSGEVERSVAVQAWGCLGVCGYLGYGVAKVVPIVLDGLTAIEEWWQWGLLAACLLFFAYVEGYRGFQLGFSPRVVSRAYVVAEDAPDAPFWHKILAPAFCIGYFHGTTKRVVTSWAVTCVIFAVVIGVKQLANPYRAIIDAGVIVGLFWGIISILVFFAQTVVSKKPIDFDPALPEDTPYTEPRVSTADEK